MKKVVYYEWLHFTRNIARPIAIILFLMAACFGEYNGYKKYQIRLDAIEEIETGKTNLHEDATAWFAEGLTGPEDRSWVNITEPFWSMWYANHHVIDVPHPNMIFNIGQSEHFGYYKRVSMWTTAMDDDLTAEIANPEFVQLGALDFTFVWLYLMPLLLIILTYQIKGLEHDLGFLRLLTIQNPFANSWLLQRVLIIGLGLLLLQSLCISLPILLVPEMSLTLDVFLLWSSYALYLVLWLILVYLVIRFGKGQSDQAMKMLGIWILLNVAIPGLVNQYVLIEKPADLMLSLIEAKRSGQNEIYDLPEDEVKERTYELIPELKKSKPARIDSLQSQDMINGAYRLVRNEYMSDVTGSILNDQMERNKLIAASFWFNPVTGFHYWLNKQTNTGHEANLEFRNRIQFAGEQINKTLILDEWNEKQMNQELFEEYIRLVD